MKRAVMVLSAGLCLLAGCTTTDSQRSKQPERAAELNLELGIDALRKGNLQQAKDKIDRALDQNPRYGRAHAIAGMLYERLGETNKADSHFQRAVSLDPDNPEIKNNYAAYLCQKDRFERGEKLALEAAANPLYKTPEIALLNAGNCARSAGDLKRAEDSYRRALGIRPRFGEALLQMADLEYRQTEYMSARAFLERHLAIARATPVTLWLGVRIERGLGNKAQAQQYEQRLKSEYPTASQTKELLLESERNPG
ncbi:MAG: type IV pilus biogenesis/stability protein PilW [Steroidobacteraceae bacterium]